MIRAAGAHVTGLPGREFAGCNGSMTHHDGNPDEHHHDATADEALPDGQFDDQKMPTTDGEPADGDDPAADAGAESPEEGDAAMRAAEEATKND